MTQPAYIALGSNLGDRRAILDRALAELARVPGVTSRSVSSYLETAPIGGPPDQGPFLNAAAGFETVLSVVDFHGELERIEREAGRFRGIRWGERTLDLDLLLYGNVELMTPELTVPHPRMVVRRFVLSPLSEIAPRVIHPSCGSSIQEMLARLDLRTVAFLGWSAGERARLRDLVPAAWKIVEEDFEAGEGLVEAASFAVIPAGASIRIGRELVPPYLRIDMGSSDYVGELKAAFLAADGA